MNRQALIEIGFAITVMSLGLYLMIGSGQINLGSGYDRIGPRFFPYVIACGLLVTSIIMLLGSWQQRKASDHLSVEFMPLILILAGLVICVMTIEPLGFVLSVTLLFVFIARAFKSRRAGRDVLVGLLLAIVVYFIFTRGLGLVLPKGVLAGML